MADPCEACRRAVKDGLRKTRDCETCPTTWLLPGNETAWELCAAIRPGLIARHAESGKDTVRVYRGVNWQTIDAALRRFRVPAARWEEMVAKINAYAAVLIDEELKDVGR